MSDESQHTGPPNFFTMVKNFSNEVVKFAKDGFRYVSPEDYEERLDICIKCPNIKNPGLRCGLCGCNMEVKAKWNTAACPDTPSRWKEQYIPPSPPSESNWQMDKTDVESIIKIKLNELCTYGIDPIIYGGDIDWEGVEESIKESGLFHPIVVRRAECVKNGCDLNHKYCICDGIKRFRILQKLYGDNYELEVDFRK